MSTFPQAGRLLIGSWLTLSALVGLPSCSVPRPPAQTVLLADPLPGLEGDVTGAQATEFDRGVALVQLERYAEGVVLLERALKPSSSDVTAIYHLGYAYEQLGRQSDAEASYLRVIALDPKFASARVNLGSLYLAAPGQELKAIQVLEPAVAFEPKAVDLRLNLAFAYGRLKNLDKAAEHYRAALASEDRVDIRQMLVDVLFDGEKMPEAIIEMRKLLPNFHKDARAMAAFGGRFAKARAFEDCVAAFTTAIQLDGNTSSYFLNRGLCRHELKTQEAEAASDYERATVLDPTYQPAFYYLGMSLLTQQRLVPAAEALLHAHNLGTTTPVGLKAKARWDDLTRASDPPGHASVPPKRPSAPPKRPSAPPKRGGH